MQDAPRNRVECLDGLRGIAALWVLVGHTTLLTGYRLPVISKPDLGVDLFIMLSGFLMVFHCQLRRAKEPWELPSTWTRFWIRRYFRIAPLYYVALAVALTAGPMLFEARSHIAELLPSQAQAPERFIDRSAANYLMHLSFLFGLHPDYAYRTALPDWSIGLEMQFYAAFPFLMLALARLGWLKGAIIIALISAAAGVAINRMLHFPMPSFLLLKLHVFIAGMLTAAALQLDERGVWKPGIVALALVLIPVGGDRDIPHLVGRVIIATMFFCLVHFRPAGKIPGSRFFYWLGELSYGVYLIHLLVLTPVAAWLITMRGSEMSAGQRFGIALGITVVVTYAVAAVTRLIIEIPGQRLGKKLVAS
jgi:peptidoglycan/LPS O-acetylase OafA/YrhL